MARRIAILLLGFSHPGIGALAFTRFDPTCILPTTQVNFVSSPDSRGTLDILWSCLFTIFACTWTIQHLNIPEQRDHESKNQDRLHRILYKVKQEAKSFWSNLKWMLITVVAPEFILGKAIGDFILARRLKKEVDLLKEQRVVEHHEEWELSHVFFSFMGGFRVLECDVRPEEGAQRRERVPTRGSQGDDRMGIEVLDGCDARDSRTKEDTNIQDQSARASLEWEVPGITGSRILPPNMLLPLRKLRRISRLPNITKEEIHDKSKANFFIKAIAVVQVFWVCIQVIVRSVRGLAISQLELVVTAFSICAIITYVFLIPRPQGVQVPMRPILVRRGGLLDLANNEWISLRALVIPGLNFWTDSEHEVEVVPNDAVPGDLKDLGTYALSMSVGGMIFGSIHVAGWNLEFPTPTEQELWRIASVVITCLLPFAFLPFILMIILAEAMNRGQWVSTRFLNRLGFSRLSFFGSDDIAPGGAIVGGGIIVGGGVIAEDGAIVRGRTIVSISDNARGDAGTKGSSKIANGGVISRGDTVAKGGSVTKENGRVRFDKGGTMRIATAVPAQIWGLVFGVIYIITRLFLLVETFRTLAFLPPDAFVATWVSSIPSVG